MLLSYNDLDSETRRHMLEEVERDIENGKLYVSPRLSQAGQRDYPGLLKAAVENHDDEWLANEIAQHQRLNSTVPRKDKFGFVKQTKMPSNAPVMLAAGEFNTFYIRAICLRAIEENRSIVVYRGRHSSNPRPESEASIGERPNPRELLEALRLPPEQRPSGVIPEPNSGLTVKLE